MNGFSFLLVAGALLSHTGADTARAAEPPYATPGTSPSIADSTVVPPGARTYYLFIMPGGQATSSHQRKAFGMNVRDSLNAAGKNAPVRFRAEYLESEDAAIQKCKPGSNCDVLSVRQFEYSGKIKFEITITVTDPTADELGPHIPSVPCGLKVKPDGNWFECLGMTVAGVVRNIMEHHRYEHPRP